MARTTVDDCLEQCPNHFELTHRASRRARDIMNRGDPRVPEHGDKSIVIALREIADPNALVEKPQPAHDAQVDEVGETVVFGDAADQPTPPSPDEPDPTDPMGERVRARFAAPTPTHPTHPDPATPADFPDESDTPAAESPDEPAPENFD